MPVCGRGPFSPCCGPSRPCALCCGPCGSCCRLNPPCCEGCNHGCEPFGPSYGPCFPSGCGSCWFPFEVS